jgi:ADP-heptose:LPS heptosyltransferase
MKILVIKHGALGDMVQAFRAFAGIRQAHPHAQITLLTAAPSKTLLLQSPWFDHIEVDNRLPFWNIPAVLKLRRQLRGYDRVYDLQTSTRSSLYFRLAGKPPWSGIAKGSAFLHDNPRREMMHTRERLAEQLAVAGITELPEPDLSWATGTDISGYGLPERFALLVPGASARRPEKRWPLDKFKALAENLQLPRVVVGGPDDDLPEQMPWINLAGRTSLLELAAITARAALAIGNDTGPMHLAAALNIPSLVLFSNASDPALTAPRYPDGGWPSLLRAPSLADVTVAEALSSLP